MTSRLELSQNQSTRRQYFCLGRRQNCNRQLRNFVALRRLAWWQGLYLIGSFGTLIGLQAGIDLSANKKCECAPVQPNHHRDGRGQELVESDQLGLPEVLEIEAQTPREHQPGTRHG